MGRIAFLTDRTPDEAVPAIRALGADVKTEPLEPDSVPYLLELAPTAVFVDALADPDRAFRLLAGGTLRRLAVPVVAVVAPADLARFPWDEVVAEFVQPDAGADELRLRLSLLARRSGGGDEGVLRLGPLSINRDTYQVMVAGRVLDLTYKEFELIRFLAQHPGRVYTRSALLQEVWGYDFYGGTRTVDVHVRRLRAKFGIEHEDLIETVRGVGYRAADPLM
jgi:hypothetical protein